MSWMDRVVEAVTVATITVVLLVMLVLSFALVMEVLSAMGWVRASATVCALWSS